MDSSNRASPTPPVKAEGMASTSRASRGSTPTASRSASRLAKADMTAESPARAASSNSLKQKTAAKGDEQPRASRADEVRGSVKMHCCVRTAHGTRHTTHDTRREVANMANMANMADRDQQLKALKAEFDGLRAHLTCKVCDRLLYQPYTVACGHTYCYTVSAMAAPAGPS